jgi:hypothetical protein
MTPVYLFDSGHTFTDQFVVVPELGATQDDVLQMANSAGDWEPAQQAARAKGWSVYTAAGTPYDQHGIINVALARINNTSYLFYGASRGNFDPTTVLMKPQRGGKLTTVCVFHEVRAHL